MTFWKKHLLHRQNETRGSSYYRRRGFGPHDCSGWIADVRGLQCAADLRAEPGIKGTYNALSISSSEGRLQLNWVAAIQYEASLLGRIFHQTGSEAADLLVSGNCIPVPVSCGSRWQGYSPSAHVEQALFSSEGGSGSARHFKFGGLNFSAVRETFFKMEK